MIKIDKLFRDKNTSTIIYILVAVGILLMTFGTAGKNSVPKNVEQVTELSRAREAELILSEIKGVGKVRVMISEEQKSDDSLFPDKETDGKGSKASVLIVADGGADGRIREKIIRAASVALGVDSHKIQVFERKE